jgi:plasmid stability protein
MEALMSDLLIRDIPDPLKQEVADAAKARGQSLSTKAIDLLRKGLISEREAKPEPGRSAWDILRSAFEENGPLDGEFAKVMEEIEAERKRDFGRPVDFGRDDHDRE